MANDFVFSVDAQAKCGALLKSAIALKDNSIMLRDSLLLQGILSDEDSFAMVMDNFKFKAALLKYLSVHLCRDIGPESRYGCGVVSDFDLIHNMVTDKQFNDKLDSIGFDYTNKTLFERLRKNRANLRQWLLRLRNQTIVEFDLPETPDRIEVNRNKKAKLMEKTMEDVQKEANNSLSKAKRTREPLDSMDVEDASDDESHISDLGGPEFANQKQDVDYVDFTMENGAVAPREACPPAGEVAQGGFYAQANSHAYDLDTAITMLRSIFMEFGEGKTLILKLNGVRSYTDVPSSLSCVITKSAKFLTWDATAQMELVNQHPMGEGSVSLKKG